MNQSISAVNSIHNIANRELATVIARWSDATKEDLFNIASGVAVNDRNDPQPALVDFRLLKSENKKAVAVIVDILATARGTNPQVARERLAEYFGIVESSEEYTSFHCIKDQLELLLTTDKVDHPETVATILRDDPKLVGEALDDLMRRGFVSGEALAEQPVYLQQVLWAGIIAFSK